MPEGMDGTKETVPFRYNRTDSDEFTETVEACIGHTQVPKPTAEVDTGSHPEPRSYLKVTTSYKGKIHFHQ